MPLSAEDRRAMAQRGDVEDLIARIPAGGAATEATLEAVRAAVDQLEGYLDGVEGGIGAVGDAEAATGNGSQIAILKNLRTRLSTLEGYLDGVEALLTTIRDNADGLEGGIGAATDAEAATGNGSLIAILKNVRSRLANLETLLDGLETSVDGLEAGIGAQADVEAATGNGSLVAIQKNVRSRLANIENQAPLLSISAGSGVANGTALDNLRPRSDHTLQLVFTGAPTGGVLKLQGSLDNTNWVDLATYTVGTDTDNHKTVTGKPFRYVRAAITTALSGGTTPTVDARVASA